MEERFVILMEAARRIVEAEKALYPGCEDAVAFDVGGSSSDTESRYSRAGSSTSTISNQLPTGLSDLITNMANASAPNSANAGLQNTLFSNLLSRKDSSVPGYGMLNDTMALNPVSFSGSQTLDAIASRDPFSSTFESDTQAAYEQRASDAMAQAATGQDAVRGGAARTGMAQGVLAERLASGRGEEVHNAKLREASTVLNAGQLRNMLEMARRQTQLQAQSQLGQNTSARTNEALGASQNMERARATNLGTVQMASELLGTKKGVQSDDFSGTGNQVTDSFNWGFGILPGCCFIFLEALNGKLPWYIELARRDYYTGARRHGYKWMSNWLVPLMKRFKLVKHAVNFFVIRPFLKYGAWLYGDQSGTFGFLFAPWCKAWLALWTGLGKVFKNKEVG